MAMSQESGIVPMLEFLTARLCRAAVHLPCSNKVSQGYEVVVIRLGLT